MITYINGLVNLNTYVGYKEDTDASPFDSAFMHDFCSAVYSAAIRVYLPRHAKKIEFDIHCLRLS